MLEFSGPGTDALTSPYATTLSPLTNGGYTTAPITASALQAAAAGVAGKQIEGMKITKTPLSSNRVPIFIYITPEGFISSVFNAY